MDIGQAFGYISEDERWTKKLLIGALVGAVPIANFALFGYQADIARRVAAGEARPLPEWDDFGRFFLDGLRVMGGIFIFLLPLILFVSCLSIGMAVVLQPAVSQSSSTPPPPEFFAIFGLMFLCITPYSLLMYAVWPLFTIQVARTGSFASIFQVAEMWRMVRAQPVNFLLIVLLFFGLYMAASFVILPAYILILIPCLGYLLLLALSGAVFTLVMMVVGHLQGQFIQADNNLQQGKSELEPVVE